MSRYAVTAHDPRYHVIVGWDSALGTFFGEVFDTDECDEDGDACCVVWTGTVLGEVVTVEALQARLEPLVTLPADLVVQLGVDQRHVTSRRPLPEIRLRWLDGRGTCLFSA